MTIPLGSMAVNGSQKHRIADAHPTMLHSVLSVPGFNDLRHTFATRLRAKRVHEMNIMTLLGHTTLQMSLATLLQCQRIPTPQWIL